MSDFWRLLKLFKPYAGWMILGILLALLSLAANLILMATAGWFITSMTVAGLAGAGIGAFAPAALIRAMAITRALARYFERLVSHEALFRLLARLRAWFYLHLEPLAPAGLQDYRAGDLLSRIRADIDALDNFHLRMLVPIVIAAIAVPAITVTIGLYSPQLAIAIFCLLLLAGVGVPLFASRLSRDAARRQIDSKALMRAEFVELKQGLAELQIYGAIDARQRQVEKLSAGLMQDQRRLRGLDGLMLAGQVAAAGLAVWGVLLFAAPKVAAGSLAAPDFAMLLLFILASFEAIMGLPLAVQLVPTVLAATRRLFEVIDAEPPVKQPDDPLPAPSGPLDLEIEDLRFAYDPQAAPVLNGVSLKLPQGGKLALVGPTGSGKSSVVNLLLRFWPAQTGDIRLAGEDIGRFALEDVRRQFAVVPQRIHLFNSSIRDNLLLADRQADDQRLQEACKLACIHDFIIEQPDGYDTYVGEAGLKLSGGQIRRIGVARALLKDAPVLVLDEPGEGLDPQLEHRLLHNILDARPKQSLLLITHSLTALERMDEVMVLQHGEVLERGRHDELMAGNGAYRQLHNLLGEFSVIGG